MENEKIIFDKKLYEKNINENTFSDEHKCGLSDEDVEKLKEEGIY